MRHLFIATPLLLTLASSSLAQTQPAGGGQGRDPNTGQSFVIPTATEPAPKEWIDKDTGHRVVRLSDEPNSQSMYFHQYSFSPDGKKLAFTSTTGIYQVDMQSRAIEKIIPAQETDAGTTFNNSIIMVGRKTGHIFLTRTAVTPTAQAGGAAVSQDRGGEARTVWFVIDPVSKEQPHKSATSPRKPQRQCRQLRRNAARRALQSSTSRAAAGAATQPVTARNGQAHRHRAHAGPSNLPMALLTMDTKTGHPLKTFNPSNDWDNHFQFSPTDPNLLMYCHEGPWQEQRPRLDHQHRWRGGATSSKSTPAP